MMNVNNFIAMAKKIANEYKTLYVMGCFGAPMTASNKKRYTTNEAYNRKPERTKMINAASSDTFGFDCVCLIKGILWGWNGDKNKVYGGATYCSNGVPDFGTEAMMGQCTSSSTDFKGIVPGEVLYLPGHAGIYIGNGLAVECSPAWKNKVQITAVANIGSVAGYPSRKWTKHGKLKFINYTTKKAEPASPAPSVSTKLTYTEVAKLVLRGDYGNGAVRKAKLIKEGYNYEKVQAEVQKLKAVQVNSNKKGYTGTFPILPVVGGKVSYLKKGDKGLQVKNLQSVLNWYGNYKLVVDGDFGSLTDKAVRSFQKATKLEVDGKFGKSSLAVMKSIKK